jgi:hypothetical protein
LVNIRRIAFPLVFLIWATPFPVTATAQTTTKKEIPTTGTSSTLKGTKSLPDFRIVSTEDLSIGNVVRKSYRVRVMRELSKEELSVVAERIVSDARAKQQIKAIVIFFYLPESDVRGHFTAGKATWAPDGDWGKASTSATPKLKVEGGGALGSVAKEDIADIPIDQKKRIFAQMVRFQDQGMNSEQSYVAAAKQFRITEDQAKKIAVEGAVKGWPMP